MFTDLVFQVRHAKNASVSFPKASELFRLKKDHKNLETNSYAKNLVAYFNRVSCLVDMDMSDFKDALVKLKI